MNKSERIYIHKEDVWAEGDHWMSSASRDIFEHFYKAIRNTFMVRYQNQVILELAEQIIHQRTWSQNCYSLISEAAKNKTIPVLPEYQLGREQFIEELEYFRNQDTVRSQTESDFDPVIYQDFDHFFKSANHGYGQDEESRDIIFQLYFNFMKPYSEELLIRQLASERNESELFLNEMIDELLEFNNQNQYKVFHKFVLRTK